MSQSFDASPTTNLTVKMTNPSKRNPISGNPVAYKFIPSASQLLLAHPDSIMAKRAQFAQHHVWVTKYKDGEFWAGGEFTNQSKKEAGGVADAVARADNVENTDVVVWHTFGLTVSIANEKRRCPNTEHPKSTIQGRKTGRSCKIAKKHNFGACILTNL